MKEPVRKSVPAQRVIAIRHKGPYDAMGSVYHRLRRWAGRRALKPAGSAFTVFLAPPEKHNWASAEYEVCLPIQGEAAGDAEVAVKSFPAMDVACTQVEGGYEMIPAHYAELLAWLTAAGEEIAGLPREVYLKRSEGPKTGDPKEFLTEIQFPVRSG